MWNDGGQPASAPGRPPALRAPARKQTPEELGHARGHQIFFLPAKKPGEENCSRRRMCPGKLRRDVPADRQAGPPQPDAAPHLPQPGSPRRVGWAGRETGGARAYWVSASLRSPAAAAQLCIGQPGAPPGSRGPIGRGCPTPGEGAEAESGIGGRSVPGSRPRAPPAAASPLWRRPCSPPRRGRPPGSPAAVVAACALAFAFPPASGRAPPPRCLLLRCGKGQSCARRGAAATAVTVAAPPLPSPPPPPLVPAGAESARSRWGREGGGTA